MLTNFWHESAVKIFHLNSLHWRSTTNYRIYKWLNLSSEWLVFWGRLDDNIFTWVYTSYFSLQSGIVKCDELFRCTIKLSVVRWQRRSPGEQTRVKTVLIWRRTMAEMVSLSVWLINQSALGIRGIMCQRDVSCASFNVQKDDSSTGRGRAERRGRDLGLRRCDRVAVEQNFNTIQTMHGNECDI